MKHGTIIGVGTLRVRGTPTWSFRSFNPEQRRKVVRTSRTHGRKAFTVKPKKDFLFSEVGFRLPSKLINGTEPKHSWRSSLPPISTPRYYNEAEEEDG